MTTNVLRATVTTAPAPGQVALRVRFDGGTATAPAFLAPGVPAPAAGARVAVELLGRRPIVRGGL